MQPVSQAWKDNQRQNLVTESFVEISLQVGDPDAQAQAEITTNGQESISNAQDLLDGTAAPILYATLEPFLWVLDGTRQLVGGEEAEEYEGFLPTGEEEPLGTADGKAFYSAT